MRTLSAIELVQTWEWGQDKHPLDRSLMLLTLAQPELSAEQIARLSVGQRNTRLLSLREQMLGPHIQGYAACPQCSEKLELTIDLRDIRLPEPSVQEFELYEADFAIHFRLPNSYDLAALIGLPDVATARQQLAERCVIAASCQGSSLDTAALPETLLPALAADILAHDPQAEMQFAVECPDCRHEWALSFDIVSFLWIELGDQVKRLLHDVHLLASIYGWREADILAMSAFRRQFYLDLER